MSNNSELKSIAERVRQEHAPKAKNQAILPTDDVEAGIPDGDSGVPVIPELEDDTFTNEFEQEEPESVVNGEEDDPMEDEEEPVIAGVSDFGDGNQTMEEAESSNGMMDVEFGDDFEVTDEQIKETMPDIPLEIAEKYFDKTRQEILAYRRKLILQNGMPLDEATAAALTKLQKLGDEKNVQYCKENPAALTVMVDKRNADNLEFTKEEREKIVKSKVIQLKVVEDASLKTVKTKKVDKKRKLSVLQSIETGVSMYGVPLPLMNDYVQFKGSQIMQLIKAIRYQDTPVDEMIEKKAALVFSQLVSSANIRKTDENGRGLMTYNEFLNKFLFHDLDMALYGILVASSMEEVEVELTCGNCSQPFKTNYNIKTLLTMEDMSDEFKERFDQVLAHKSDPDRLQEMYEENNKTNIVESPITHNIYHLNYPTLARAIGMYRSLDQNDENMVYLSAFALFIDKMLVYDSKERDYLEIDEEEVLTLMEALSAIPQEELDIIQQYLTPKLYTPKFVLKTKCDHCGNDMTNVMSIDDMVFLRARDSSTEITS